MSKLGPILVTDDDDMVRGLTAEILSAHGYVVLQASRAQEAFEKAQAIHFVAFLTDVHMPGFTGVELCRQLRSIPEYRITPIIVMTGSDERENLTAAFEAGCDDFLTKPLDTVALVARLKAHMQRVEYFEELERTRRLLNRYISSRTRDMAEASTRVGALPPPEQRELVVLFTDIRGFTALAEDIPPDELFTQLSAQLEEQVRLVYEHGGYIDKFGGDGVMAVFDKADMIRQSCLCALRMIDKANERAPGQDERLRQLGIGIHFGTAVIGNIGSAEHMDYSVIGTTVNLAARLCGHAERMSIVVSDAVRRGAGDDPSFRFHAQRDVPIRGLRAPVTVHTLSRHVRV